MKYFILIFSFLLIFISCKKDNDTYTPPADPLFVKLAPEETGITFKNEVVANDSFNVIAYRNFYNGAGVSIGDVNNDGLNDLFFTNNSGKNVLYLNKGAMKFEDISAKAGIQGTHNWSTGVTMADVNADGWLDIYVCNSGTMKGDNKANELYINQKNNTFKEEAALYGLADTGMTTHAAFFDYDLDGDLDCYVMNNGNRLVVKFDFSKDLRQERDKENGQRLYENSPLTPEGGIGQSGAKANSPFGAVRRFERGAFTDVSSSAGIYGSEIGFGLGINIGDVNGDKYPDMYIANDLFERDYLYINQRNGKFLEQLPDRLGHISINSMGADLADLNNDGLLDIFATDMLPEDDKRLKMNVKYDEYDVSILKSKQLYHYQYLKNMLQKNNGDGTFSEIGSFAGVDATDWSWGALIFDFENDGWKDIFVSNGVYKDINDMDYIEFVKDQSNAAEIIKKKGRFDFKDFVDLLPSKPLSSYAFVNKRNMQFKNMAQVLGLGEPGFSNGSAYGDLDNDGDLDLVVNNLMKEPAIYRNDADTKSHNNYLKVKFKGEGGNTFGIGSEVTIYAKGEKQLMNLMPTRGFQSSMPMELVFGLGKTPMIDSLVVVWGNLQMQTLKNVKVNQTLILNQKEANQRFVFIPTQTNPLYADVSQTTLLGNTKHTENLDFVDFNRERMLPHALSTQGPKIAKGDINGDGLEDFWLAGARGDAGKVFVQTPSGSFRQLNQPSLVEDKEFEDADAVFIDVDADKDFDLVVASGGYETLQAGIVRVYLNDGKGNLKGSPQLSPQILVNASCIRANDIDGDGDMDIFVGGRAVPGSYGISPQSYLLRNDQDKWTDITPETLRNVGMVTDALWQDYDQDNQKDLIVIGEWMPITFFKNENQTINYQLSIPNSNGWWNTLKAADLDGDGDIDFVLGNVGLNTKFRASTTQPMMAYINDFDKNETPECVITYYKSDGKAYPHPMKPDMVGQMPSLKKQLLHYKDYAGKSIEEIFSKEQMKAAITKKAFLLESVMLINEGGTFTIKPLPEIAQYAPINGIILQDLDGDKAVDMLLAGNFFGLKPEVGRWDANYGVFLKGNGKGQFNFVPNAQTGITLKGEVRDLTTINGNILVGKNNAGMVAFRRK